MGKPSGTVDKSPTRLEEVRARHHNNLTKSQKKIAFIAKSRRKSLDYYSQEFQKNGRRFFFHERTGQSDDDLSTDELTQESLVEENEKLKKKLKDVQADREKLKESLSQVNVQVQSASKTILSTKLREANARFSALEVDFREIQGTLEDKDDYINDLLTKLKRLEKDNTKLASQYKSFDSDSVNESESNLEELQEKIRQLQVTNKKLMLEKMRRTEELDGSLHHRNNIETLQREVATPLLPRQLRSFGSKDLIFVSKTSLYATSLLLVFGSPGMATLASASGIAVFFVQKKPTLKLLVDMKQWVLVHLLSLFASLFSSFLLGSLVYGTTTSLQSLILGKAAHVSSGLGLGYFLLNEQEDDAEDLQSFEQIQFMDIHIKILEGRNLVAKDKNIFGRPTTSDPYVKIYHANNYVGETSIVWKTLNPKWEHEKFKMPILPKSLKKFDNVECLIYDKDRISSDDSMGTVVVPIPQLLNKPVNGWFPVHNGKGDDFCRNATGELKVEIELRPLLSRTFKNEIQRVSTMKSMSTRNLAVTKRV